MRKKGISMLVMLPLFIVTACGRSEGTLAEIGMELQDMKTITDETAGHVTDRAYQDEKNLVIDADVEIGELEELTEITIRIDEERVQKFINEQIKVEYPEISEDMDETEGRKWSYEKDGQLLLSCTLTETSVTNYVDVLKDVNAPYLDDGEHILEYGYITELNAPGVGLSAEEAAEAAAQCLAEYSSFVFQPWNILAGDRPDESEKAGYYAISMQPVYEGIPVSVKNDSTIPGLSTTVMYSEDGIFQIQGAFMFSVSNNVEIEKIVSLDSVLEKFKSNFSAFAAGDNISVNRITFEYFPQMNDDYSYTLSPVWNFYCSDTRTEVINGEEQEISLRYSYLYFAENGELCGMYY